MNSSQFLMLPLLLTITVNFQFSCKNRNEDSSLRVANGTEIPSADHPAVVKIVVRKDGLTGERNCTGVFINHAQVLTAASCVKNNAQFLLTDRHPWVSSTKLAFSIEYNENMPSKGNDIAILTFPVQTPPGIAGIIDRFPRVSDIGEMVGYGSTENRFNSSAEAEAAIPSTAGIKRIGRNEVAEVGKTLKVVGPVGSSVRRNNATLGVDGDFGAPFFIDGRVAGIASYSKLDPVSGTVESFFTNLADPEVRQFLATNILSLSSSQIPQNVLTPVATPIPITPLPSPIIPQGNPDLLHPLPRVDQTPVPTRSGPNISQVKASFKQKDFWPGGGCFEMFVTNLSHVAVTDWEVGVKLHDSRYKSSWQLDFTSRIAPNQKWNKKIDPNQSLNVGGFCLDGLKRDHAPFTVSDPFEVVHFAP